MYPFQYPGIGCCVNAGLINHLLAPLRRRSVFLRGGHKKICVMSPSSPSSSPAPSLAFPSGLVRSVSIVAKTWRDRVNGNSYFSARITIEYTSFSTVVLYCPLRYGYGDMWQYWAAKMLAEKFELPDAKPGLWQIEDANKDVCFFKIATPTKKRDAVAWGRADV